MQETKEKVLGFLMLRGKAKLKDPWTLGRGRVTAEGWAPRPGIYRGLPRHPKPWKSANLELSKQEGIEGRFEWKQQKHPELGRTHWLSLGPGRGSMSGEQTSRWLQVTPALSNIKECVVNTATPSQEVMGRHTASNPTRKPESEV